MAKPKFISICNQKGGVGKSNFTILAASYMCYEKGYNVAIFDCDHPQYSSKNLRMRETKQVQSIPSFNKLAQEQFDRIERAVYPIINVKPDDALTVVNDWLNKTETKYDVIFFDLPGTVNSESLIHLLDQMDYLLIPMIADRLVMESTLEFAFAFKGTMAKQRKKNPIHLFWNMVDAREKNSMYQVYGEIMNKLELPVMKARFPMSSKFRKEIETDSQRVFRSTIFPASRASVRGTSIDVESFVNEICSIIQITTKKKDENDKGGVQREVLEEAVIQ